MDEYILLIAATFFLAIAAFMFLRAKKAKKILIKHLEENRVKWIDIRWVISKVAKINTLGSLSMYFEVILKTGEIESYLVGSWWSGLLNPMVKKIENNNA